MHFKGSDVLHNITVQDEAVSAEVAVPESRKTFCLESGKRILCPNTHASHRVICDRNRRATKLILLNQFL